MKKFNKTGHLQGNTHLPKHASPFIQGTEAVDSSGHILTLRDLSTPWYRELNIETDQSSSPININLDNANTLGNGFPGHLQTTVDYINSQTSDVVASIKGGALILQTTSSGVGSYIRILPTVNHPTASVDFGFVEHPHSQATVEYKDLKTAATNTILQGNPTGTSLVAHGEDRSSANFNRAVYAVATNSEVNQTMLQHKVARMVSIKIPIDSNGTNSRFIIDTTTNTVKAISLNGSSPSDSITSSGILDNRVLIGTLGRTSTLRDIRRLFQISDPDNKEIIHGPTAEAVRIAGVVTGSAIGTISHPLPGFDLDSTHPVFADSGSIGDNGNILGVNIPRNAGATSKAITSIIDKYTIECASATFIASGVAPLDILYITGSTTNNGEYLVENVISETVLEVRPFESNDLVEIDESSVTGNVSVKTGGMWLKDVTIYLSAPLQLPLTHDVYLTVPMENTTGNLDENAPISERNVEVPYWVIKNLYLDKSLDGAYKGTATGRKAAGYYITADARPVVTDVSSYRANSPGTVVRSLSTLTVKPGNILELSINTSDTFLEEDLGRFLVLGNTASPSSPTDSDILNREYVVIVKLLDSKRVEVRRVSRSTVDLPVSTQVATADIVTEDATPFLPGARTDVNQSTSLSIGGSNYLVENIQDASMIEPDVHLTNAEFVRLHKFNNSPTGNPLFRATITSPDTLECLGIDGDYVNMSYPNNLHNILTSNLYLRIYNGDNAGWYLITEIADIIVGPNATPKSSVTLKSLDGSTPSLASITPPDSQFASLYKIAGGSRAVIFDPNGVKGHAQSVVNAASNNQEFVTGLNVTWKGVGEGITVHSNLYGNTSTNASKGVGSKGINIRSYAGPGSSGLVSVVAGARSFNSATMLSTKEYSISTADGLGSFAVSGESETFHLDPLYLGDPSLSSHSYKGGAGFFKTSTNDPALVVSAASAARVPIQQASASNIVSIRDQSETSYGQNEAALSLYGSMLIRTGTLRSKLPRVLYTETVASFNHVYSAEPGPVDITDMDIIPKLGAQGVVVRGDSSNGLASPSVDVKDRDYDIFNIPHDFIIRVRADKGKINTIRPGPDNFATIFLVDNWQDLVGSHLFLINDGSTQFTQINSRSDSTAHVLPFVSTVDTEITGCKIGFKLIACKVSGLTISGAAAGSYAEALFAVSSDGQLSDYPTLGTTYLDLSCVIYRSRFKAAIDLVSWTRIGADNTTQLNDRTFAESLAQSDSGAIHTSHKTPVLSAVDMDQTVSIDDNTSILTGSPNTPSQGLTRRTLPSSDSSLSETLDYSQSTHPKPFYFDGSSDRMYQAADLSVLPGEKSLSPFPSNNIHIRAGSSNQQEVSFGSQTIHIDIGGLGNASFADRVFVAGPSATSILSRRNSIGSANPVPMYRGGGRKLVFNGGAPALLGYTMKIKLGAKHSPLINGFTLNLVCANSRPSDETPLSMVISLSKITVNTPTRIPVASKSVTLDNSVGIANRRYETVSVSFSKDILEKGGLNDRDILNNANSVYEIRVVFTLLPGTLEHTDIGALSGTQPARQAIAAGLGGTLVQTGVAPLSGIPIMRRGYTIDPHPRFIDSLFVKHVEVVHDKKQASLTSGLDIDGTVQPKGIRLLAPVTGYQIVGPASADLLQNSEYGNNEGHGTLYDDTLVSGGQDTNTSSPFFQASVNGNLQTNLEGRDVGLLPMWHSFYPWVHTHNPVFPSDTAGGYAGMLGMTDLLAFEHQSSTDVMENTYKWFNFNLPPDVVEAFLSGDEPLNNGTYALGNVDDFAAAEVFERGTFRWNAGDKTVSQDYWSEYGIVLKKQGDRIFMYTAPVAITLFYRPKFDKSSFFRKGAHSCAIHAHIPYFDPLFYWEFAASGITYNGPQVGGAGTNNYLYKDGYYRSHDTPYDFSNSGKPAVHQAELGSYRQSKSAHYQQILDSTVNPDSFVPPGRTGFIVPLDPPHGSRLRSLDLKLSFRPCVTREFGNNTDKEPGDLTYNWGVWMDLPTNSSNDTPDELTGEYWMSKPAWDSKEGYLIRVWRHCPFDENMVFGHDVENNSDYVDSGTTATSINMSGNATLLFEKKVFLKHGDPASGKMDGRVGSAVEYVQDAGSSVSNDKSGLLREALSSVRVELPGDKPEFTADRANYSYFVTIEFYTGVRKPGTNIKEDSTVVNTYRVPGLSHYKMDRFNTGQLPYMWTAAFPGHRPESMSTIFGNDTATRWEGYLTPYPSYQAVNNKRHPNSIYRGHALNIGPNGDAAGFIHNDGSGVPFSMYPTISGDNLDAAYAGGVAFNDTSASNNSARGAVSSTIGGGRGIHEFFAQRRSVYDHSIWYPVIKFRGLRLAYETDRPGHGGWGG